MASDSRKAGHHWRFNRLGGFDQVMIESGDDIRNLPGLEQKLWAALSCPAGGVAFDPHTLALLDADGDGRIRVGEVLAAVTWTCKLLKDPGDLFKHADGLPLSAIDDSTEDGKLRLFVAISRPKEEAAPGQPRPPASQPAASQPAAKPKA